MTSGIATKAESASATRSGGGVFSAEMLRYAIQQGMVKAAPKVGESQIQPASLDLRLGKRAYRLRSSFLPGNERIQTRLQGLKIGPPLILNEPGGAVLDPGHPYLIPLVEKLKLPPDTHRYDFGGGWRRRNVDLMMPLTPRHLLFVESAGIPAGKLPSQ